MAEYKSRFMSKEDRLTSIPGARVSGTKVETGCSRFSVACETKCQISFFPLSSVPPTSPSECFMKIPSLFFLPTRVRADL